MYSVYKDLIHTLDNHIINAADDVTHPSLAADALKVSPHFVVYPVDTTLRHPDIRLVDEADLFDRHEYDDRRVTYRINDFGRILVVKGIEGAQWQDKSYLTQWLADYYIIHRTSPIGDDAAKEALLDIAYNTLQLDTRVMSAYSRFSRIWLNY